MNKYTNEQIQMILLGRLTIDIQIVIITPIVSAFNKLSEKLRTSNINKSGFFQNSCFQTENGYNGMLVCIPQGIGAQDVMYAFNDVDVVFFGYAGSLYSNIKIGTIVEVKKAINTEGIIYPLNVAGTYENVICGYSPCLLGGIATQHCVQAHLLNCQVVDMETVYCAFAALENNNRFSALLVISDIPNVISFWNLSEETKIFFKKKCIDAIDNIVLYVNKYNKEK